MSMAEYREFVVARQYGFIVYEVSVLHFIEAHCDKPKEIRLLFNPPLTLSSAESSSRTELRIEDGPNGAQTEGISWPRIAHLQITRS